MPMAISVLLAKLIISDFVKKTKVNNMQLVPYQPEGTEEIASKMESLFSEYQIYEQNVQKIMWEPKLRPYLDFGEKVDRLYYFTHQNTHILAQQLMQWGYNPQASSQDILALSVTNIQALGEVTNFDEAIKSIVQMSQQLLAEVQEVFYTAAAYEEKNSMELMTRFAWQLKFAMSIFRQVRFAQNN